VDEITRAASSIARGDPSTRVALPGARDEVGRLASVFNEMIASLESAMNRERQFTSDASHELRTPLSVILAEAEAGLDDGASRDERGEALAVIREKGLHMRSLLSALLTLARGERDRQLEASDVDVGGAILDIAETCRPQAEERGMLLRAEGEPGLFVEADLQLLTRAVLNLIDNAVKYGREGGEIRVKARRDGGFAVLSVRNDGRGVAPENLPRVFGRFFREDPARSGGGFGLGLAIVKRIAESHGGSVLARSECGKWAEFSMTLPLAENKTVK
jgi:signal transduction histidine kinase